MEVTEQKDFKTYLFHKYDIMKVQSSFIFDNFFIKVLEKFHQLDKSSVQQYDTSNTWLLLT